jgi:hypothetical protein
LSEIYSAITLMGDMMNRAKNMAKTVVLVNAIVAGVD